MPPDTESSVPTIPNTTISTNPQVPNNSFAIDQASITMPLPAGNFGFLTACFPSFYSLFSSSACQRSVQITSRQQQDTNDNYEIALECIDVNFKEGFIGGGNQSTVFKGKWNGRFIALKKLNRASEVDIRKLVALDHKNIVKTIGICSKDIYPCIVMEFVTKGSLFDLLRKEHVGKHKFLRWAREIASGMQYLHNEWHIIHRDLKSPNILVDANDTLKICDFGSLYSWDKTYMQSAPMSLCGTSSWMSPEMLKNEPCNEKVDTWSYGVVLWEVLIQELPYKHVSSMAIIFGVGSGNLRLHLPKTLPDTCKLLFNICFAKRSRNRPSFTSILNHLDNLEVEIANINEDGWSMRKQVWKREVNEESDKLRQNSLNGNVQELDQKQLEELTRRRMNELRHAQELHEMYRRKMERVDDLMENLTSMLQNLAYHEQKYERERLAKPRAETVAPAGSQYSPLPLTSKHVSVPELKSVKVKKTTMVNMRGKKMATDLYSRAGQPAVVTMEIDDESADLHNNNAGSDESLYETDAEDAERAVHHACVDLLPNIPTSTLSSTIEERLVDGGSIMTTPKCRISQSSISSSDDEQFVAAPRSRHSYGTSSHQNSFEECCNTKFSSRDTSARSSINFVQRKLPATVRSSRNSIDYLPRYECVDEQPTVFKCPSCSYNFQRNCTARISGISNDSGVASERQMSTMTLASFTNEDCVCAQKSDIYRNQEARWSDGRIHRHKNNTSQTAVLRTQHRPNRRPTGSFTRNSPARRLTSSVTTKRHRAGFDRNSTGCLELAAANDASQQMPSTSSACPLHCVFNSQLRLDKHDDDIDMPHQESGLSMHQRVHDAIQEMDSSMSSKSNRSPKKSMEQSFSTTMASSLERSLELGIADGLSDREMKLKTVRATYKTHRRCASNPTNPIVESTESSDDPVYC